MKEAVIVSGVRTPIGAFNGSLGNTPATKLGALVIDEAIKRAGIGKEMVNEAIMGMVLPCGYGQNPAKQAAVQAYNHVDQFARLAARLAAELERI